MEPTPPAMALATGAALLVMLGGGAAPVIGSATAAEPTTTSASHSQVLAAHSTSARLASSARSSLWSGRVNTNRLSTVNSAYQKNYAAGLRIGTGFTGSESRCQAGSTSASSRLATLRAINFVRSMSGLAPVGLNSTLNARSQRTALMMSAQKALSHAPSRRWRCYSAVGAANAGKSNLALAYPNITSAGVVNQYMKDAGTNNHAVGHRRWLLNPFATTMGSGSTRTANALTVIGPKSMSRPNPSYVSWPSAGYFPKTLEPGGRWSLSAGNLNTSFRYATVRVSRNGKPVAVRKYGVENGYAQPTLVWQMRASSVASGTVHVIVSGIRVAGSHRVYSRNYYVKMFTPR